MLHRTLQNLEKVPEWAANENWKKLLECVAACRSSLKPAVVRARYAAPSITFCCKGTLC